VSARSSIHPAWLERSDATPLQRVVLAPLSALACCYDAVTHLRRAAYVRGFLHSTRLPCRVVSVGGLTAGGSGKTPFAAWLAAALRRRGHRVVLASRGYRRRGRGPVTVVSDGERLYAGVDAAGDEPFWLAARVPGVPVLVGSDRVALGLRALSSYNAEILLLDDGFQHLRLARDVDIVLIDSAAPFGNGYTLPRGLLRENPHALASAHSIGVLGGTLSEEDAARVTALAPVAFRFCVRKRAVGLRALGGGTLEQPEKLAGTEVGVLCGIAKPASLLRSVEELGARVVAERRFPDHHRYRARDLSGLAAEVPLWITTEKDAVKLAPEWLGEAELRVLCIELEVENAERFLLWLEECLQRAY